jgi:hypothetical protein
MLPTVIQTTASSSVTRQVVSRQFQLTDQCLFKRCEPIDIDRILRSDQTICSYIGASTGMLLISAPSCSLLTGASTMSLSPLGVIRILSSTFARSGNDWASS